MSQTQLGNISHPWQLTLERLKSLDYPQFSQHDVQIKCHEGLAISFGSEEQLTEWQKTIDKNLKVASALAIKAIRKLPDGQKDWNSILVTLSRIATLVPAGDPVQRNEIISHERKAGWDFKSKVDEVLKMKVESWFSNLIGDRNIRKTTPIDIEQIANIVATVGTDFEWKKALSEGTTRKTFLDIGILRLPNKEDPVIKLYRIQLEVIAMIKRSGPRTTNKSGIGGVYDCQTYKPSQALLDSMKTEAAPQIAEAADIELAALLGPLILE